MDLTVIKDLIQKDKIEEAINELKKVIKDNEFQEEVIIYSARLKSITKKTRMGVIDFDTENLEKNKIRKSILLIVNELEKNKPLASNNGNNNQKELIKFESLFRNRKFVYLIIAFVAIALMVFLANRQNITGIKGDNNDNNKIHITK